MKRLYLSKGKEKSVLRYHPWVFSGAIRKKDADIHNGDIVEVLNADGDYLATGHYHDNSIAVRIFSFTRIEPTYDFWKRKISLAFQYRQTIHLVDNQNTTMYRLVNGEGDGLPGLIIDMYNQNAVMQFHSYGMYLLQNTFVRILQELYPHLQSIYNKSATTLNDMTNYTPEDELLYGSLEDVVAKENDLTFHIDIRGGQKTGFFLDQRDSRAMVGRLAHNHQVLNMFCYSGGFSMYALQGGAAHVDSVDISRKAIELTNSNVELLNDKYADRHTAYCANVFEFLENMPAQQYDLIVLDPPAFAKHHKVIEQGLKGYRNINRKAMEKIKSGGLLFTFSCSQAISIDTFQTVLFSAAAIEHKNIRIVQQMQHALDHPVSIYHPEGNYLKGFLLAIE